MTARERVNILLVDDQAARLLSYEAILAPLEQNLVRASSGVEALQKLLKEEFAVILLDVSMPEMDGFETAALIHQHPRFERTPIIFVTGHNITDMDALRGYELGAVDYVYVPIVPEILRGKVSVLVELHLKPRGAIIEGTRQDNPDDARAVRVGSRAKQGIDRGTETVLLRAFLDADPIAVDQQMVIGLRDVDLPLPDPVAVFRMDRRQRPIPAENLWQTADCIGRNV